MASATARKRTRYAETRGTYGNLAYAEPAVRPLERGGSEVLRPQPKVRTRERAAVRPKVRVREAGQISVFAVVGFLAVGVFAVLLMLSTVQLTRVSDEMISLKSQLSNLQSEEKKLMAQYELAYDLSTIEQKVTSDGSMVKPQSSQIYTLDLSEEDSVVHYSRENGGAETVDSLILLSVEHNLKLMHQLSSERKFGNIIEAARSAKSWQQLRAYLDVFDEYCTYLSVRQKTQALAFLYELLIHREGDIRRQAASLIGKIIAKFHARRCLPTPALTRRRRCPSPCGRSIWTSSSTPTTRPPPSSGARSAIP